MRMHRRATLATVALLSAISLAACGGSSPTDSTAGASDGAASGISGEVTVLAAASLKEAFPEIADKVKEENPDLTITFDFKGSQDLVTALAEGQAADVLATANDSTMKDAADKSLVGEQTEFATNVLTLIVPKGNPKRITGLDSSLDGANLVICAPEVPCGKAAHKLADAKGITLNPVSEEQQVKDVVGKVESGEADAGLVYVTDATTAGDKVEKIDIPANNVINHYPIATTAQTVDLPEPLGPTSATVRPAGTVRSTTTSRASRRKETASSRPRFPGSPRSPCPPGSSGAAAKVSSSGEAAGFLGVPGSDGGRPPGRSSTRSWFR